RRALRPACLGAYVARLTAPGAAQSRASRHLRAAARMNVLILSWEYPPIVAGGLARHVRKLSENLAAEGVEVHVLTRGSSATPGYELLAVVHVHRVPETTTPKDLDEFLAWV